MVEFMLSPMQLKMVLKLSNEDNDLSDLAAVI